MGVPLAAETAEIAEPPLVLKVSLKLELAELPPPPPPPPLLPPL